jgi:putative oxidoreductase
MWNKCVNYCNNPSLGLLLLRLALGVVFVYHGVTKFQNMEATIGFFASLGLGAAIAWAVTIVETLGGAALLLGVGTQVAGVVLALVMLGAIITVKGAMGFSNGGYEFDLVLLLALLAVVFTGPGRYTVRKVLAR